MENSIYLGLSRQMVLQTNMDIVANNVANMSTPGFRGQNLVFEEYIADPRGSDDPLSFVYDESQYQLTEPGPVSFTENPLDIYLAGPGFMGVKGPGNETVYTRAGNLQIAPDGTLITSSGFTITDAGGGQITIPPDSAEISIDDRGFVSNQDGTLGQIMVTEFENLQELEPLGNNLYRTDARGGQAFNTTVKQGQLEGSNIKPVVEMTRMIDTLRSFQAVQQLMQTENERLSSAIERLSQRG